MNKIKERIEELEAKAYFEDGLNEEDTRELDRLIAESIVWGHWLLPV